MGLEKGVLWEGGREGCVRWIWEWEWVIDIVGVYTSISNLLVVMVLRCSPPPLPSPPTPECEQVVSDQCGFTVLLAGSACFCVNLLGQPTREGEMRLIRSGNGGGGFFIESIYIYMEDSAMLCYAMLYFLFLRRCSG